jgi:hypothetical protein
MPERDGSEAFARLRRAVRMAALPIVLFLCLVTLLASGLAQNALAQTRTPADLARATLEELMNITSSSSNADGCAS